MTEKTIFKTYLFLTKEEEQAYKEEIANYMNDFIGKDEEPWTVNDNEVQERLYQDIWEMYDVTKIDLDKQLPNNIIALGTVGLWSGKVSGGKVLGNNLNEILYTDNCDELKIVYDRYNVHGVLANHDGQHEMIYRMVKVGIDANSLLRRHIKKPLTNKELSRYTVSLVPAIKEIYG